MSQDFLGAGFTFPLALDKDGRVALACDEDIIRRSLWLILSTSPGERAMRPDFGCGLTDYVFAAPSPEVFGQIAAAVERAVLQWEPRVALESVDVRPDPADASCLLIDLTVQILALNTSLNLVYPFYLGESTDGV